MAAGDKDATETELSRNVGVVKGVADEENVLRRKREVAKKRASLLEFGTAVEVADAMDAGEKGREVVGVHCLIQQRLMKRGKDGLRKLRVGATLKARAGVGEKFLAGVGVKIIVVVLRERLPRVGREVSGKADVGVVIANRKTKMREVILARGGWQVVLGEEAVEGVEGSADIVEQGAVPVPNDVFEPMSVQQGFFNRDVCFNFQFLIYIPVEKSLLDILLFH